jgi:hypothetical protein
MHDPSPPFRGEREGPAPKAWEGEVGAGNGVVVGRSGIPHLTPTLSASGGFAQESVIPGRRVAGNPESIFQSPEFMDSGFAAFGRAPE